MTNIINVNKQNLNKLGYKDLHDWLKDDNHAYIGRPLIFYDKPAIKSKWHNPFRYSLSDYEEKLELYKQYILSNENLVNDLHELKDKVLGSSFYPFPCHGEVLLELIDLVDIVDNI